MKFLLKFSFAIIAAIILFVGCKKGENDPFLSLKSRTSRLVGEWKLLSADYTETEANDFGEYYSTVYSYDGTSMTETYTIFASGVQNYFSDTYIYSNNYEFEKDGTFEQIENVSGSNSVVNGYWAWSHQNSEQNLKNKEAIIITNSMEDDFTYSGQSISPSNILVFEKLSSNEIVIVLNQEENYDYGTFSKTGTLTFEKK